MSLWTESLGLDGGVRKEPNGRFTDMDRMMLFAADARGPLSQDIVLANARRRYPLAGADAGLAACSDDSLDAGAPCACRHIPEWRRCAVPPSETRVGHEYCSGRFDDAKKQILDVRRECQPEGAACDLPSRLCCTGICDPSLRICRTPDARATDDAAPSEVRDDR